MLRSSEAERERIPPAVLLPDLHFQLSLEWWAWATHHFRSAGTNNVILSPSSPSTPDSWLHFKSSVFCLALACWASSNHSNLLQWWEHIFLTRHCLQPPHFFLEVDWWNMRRWTILLKKPNNLSLVEILPGSLSSDNDRTEFSYYIFKSVQPQLRPKQSKTKHWNPERYFLVTQVEPSCRKSQAE